MAQQDLPVPKSPRYGQVVDVRVFQEPVDGRKQVAGVIPLAGQRHEIFFQVGAQRQIERLPSGAVALVILAHAAHVLLQVEQFAEQLAGSRQLDLPRQPGPAGDVRRDRRIEGGVGHRQRPVPAAILEIREELLPVGERRGAALRFEAAAHGPLDGHLGIAGFRQEVARPGGLRFQPAVASQKQQLAHFAFELPGVLRFLLPQPTHRNSRASGKSRK